MVFQNQDVPPRWMMMDVSLVICNDGRRFFLKGKHLHSLINATGLAKTLSNYSVPFAFTARTEGLKNVVSGVAGTASLLLGLALISDIALGTELIPY